KSDVVSLARFPQRHVFHEEKGLAPGNAVSERNRRPRIRLAQRVQPFRFRLEYRQRFHAIDLEEEPVVVITDDEGSMDATAGCGPAVLDPKSVAEDAT